MSDTRPCTDCGETIKRTARSCSCGWKAAAPAAARAPGGMPIATGDPDHMRCAWESNGTRCRYYGSCSERGGQWYCRGHFGCMQTMDGEHGQRIVEESIEKVPEALDYSANACMQRARERARLVCTEADPDFDPNRRTAAALAGAPRGGMFKHVGALAAITAPKAPQPANPTASRYEDDEGRREREAIQGETQW